MHRLFPPPALEAIFPKSLTRCRPLTPAKRFGRIGPLRIIANLAPVPVWPGLFILRVFNEDRRRADSDQGREDHTL
jgi:hypothetical protein